MSNLLPSNNGEPTSIEVPDVIPAVLLRDTRNEARQSKALAFMAIQFVAVDLGILREPRLFQSSVHLDEGVIHQTVFSVPTSPSYKKGAFIAINTIADDPERSDYSQLEVTAFAFNSVDKRIVQCPPRYTAKKRTEKLWQFPDKDFGPVISVNKGTLEVINWNPSRLKLPESSVPAVSLTSLAETKTAEYLAGLIGSLDMANVKRFVHLNPDSVMNP